MHLDIDGTGGAFMTYLQQLKRFEVRISLFKSLDCPLALAAAGRNQRFTRYPPVINHNQGWCNWKTSGCNWPLQVHPRCKNGVVYFLLQRDGWCGFYSNGMNCSTMVYLTTITSPYPFQLCYYVWLRKGHTPTDHDHILPQSDTANHRICLGAPVAK